MRKLVAIDCLHTKRCLLLFMAIFFLSFYVAAQMRQVHLEMTGSYNRIKRFGFYSPAEGYIAGTGTSGHWIGHTTDTGRTYIKKYFNYVNFNGYMFNWSLAFSISGVKVINQSSIIVYGDYGYVPAILYSNNGGDSYTLVYYSQYDPWVLRTGIKDLAFSQNNTVGYAVDADRILKTNDGGLTWNVSRTDPGSYFDCIEVIDDNTVYAISTEYSSNKILRTYNGGLTWQQINLPNGGHFNYAYFMTAFTGWVNIFDDAGNKYFYKTTDGGTNWVLRNNIEATPFDCQKFIFTDNNTGYSLVSQNMVWKTVDGGSTWEPLPRDNNFEYLGYSHEDLHYYHTTNQIWAGGNKEFIELATNGGGQTLPKSYFSIDTIGVAATGIVNLKNFSKPAYTSEWTVNGTSVGTSYNTFYTHNINRAVDTISLIVGNGTVFDTTIKYKFFNVPAPPVPLINSFDPLFGQEGSIITINGNNLLGTISVKFGGTPATSFTVISNTKVLATLGIGSSGSIEIVTPYGTAIKPGFSSLTPIIESYTPTSGGTNTTVTITGQNLNIGNPHFVRFGDSLAQSVTILGSTLAVATVGNGATGDVTFQTQYGIAKKSGFTYIPPPKIISFTPTSANQGAEVTITGTNLMGATNVKFGNVNAQSFTVVSPTAITATVGSGASGYIKVITQRGADSLAGFDYTSPTITGFYPVIGGRGAKITIVGKKLSGANAVSFGNINAASFSVTSDTSIIATVANGNNGDIKVQTPNGTDSESGFIFTTVPTISSLLPQSGPIGVQVKILGSNFSSVQANNIVFFGSIRADVIAATENQITVTAPLVSVCSPVTVVSNGLTTTSATEFITTFNGGDITPESFSQTTKFFTESYCLAVVSEDFNYDSKPDIAAFRKDTVSLFRNYSTPGVLQLGSRKDFFIDSTAGYSVHQSLLSGDINNDGKKDLIVPVIGGVAILLNNSTPGGTISMEPPLYIKGMSGIGAYRKLSMGDINLDGKLDLFLGGRYYVLNNSTASTISFSSPYFLPVSNSSINEPFAVTINDFDNDGRADVAVTNLTYSTTGMDHKTYEILVNKSTPGGVSLISSGAAGSKGIYPDIVSADIDIDGHADISIIEMGFFIAPNIIQGGENCIVLKNGNTPNKISFSEGVFACGSWPEKIAIANLNGDNKPDLIIADAFLFNVMQNTSSAQSISFNRVKYFDDPINHNTTDIIASDMDLDGKPDMIVTESTQPYITIYKNRSGGADTVAVCSGTSVTLKAKLVAGTYQWQADYGAGFVNINNNTNFSGSQTSNLQISNIPETWSGYKFRCLANNTFSTIQVLKVRNGTISPSVSITSSMQGSPCSTELLTFTATPIDGGINPSYQWQVNGINTGADTNFYSASALSNGTQIKVIMTSHLVCASPATTSSNIIAVSVMNMTTPSIIVNGTTTIATGQNTIISSSQINGGASPAYQWQDSTASHTWQNISGATGSTINYTPTQTGAKLRCQLISNASCVSNNTVFSNVLTFTVTQVTAINPVPAAEYNIRYYPNPVHDVLYIDSLRIADKWETVEIFAMGGFGNLPSKVISGRAGITINVESLPAGQYIAVLRRKIGSPAFLKFIKL